MDGLDTPRISLRPLEDDDAPFILELLNDGAFIRFIGDRKVRNLEQARKFIAEGPRRSYREFGLGLLLMQLKADGAAAGLCGLLQRDYLPDPDLGFALLPRYRERGLCMEAAREVLKHAAEVRKIRRVAAIVQPDNSASLALLHGLGFAKERSFKLCATDPELWILSTEFGKNAL